MKKLMLGLLVVGVGVATWRGARTDASQPKLLFDRFWIDRMPRDIHDKHQALFVSGEHPVGNFQNRTIWTGQWEGFHYHVVPREDAAMDLIFPNTNEVQRVTWSVRHCSENGFDLCLEIAGASRGTRRYYSKKDWGTTDPSFEPMAQSSLAPEPLK